MKIVFFGSSKYVIPTIQMLSENFDLALIITTEKKESDAVPAYSIQNNIPYLSVKNLRDMDEIEKIKKENATVGVLGYFGSIVPQEVLSIFPKGIINIHPSLLPLYRGPTPVQSALLNGDDVTGTTIIILDKDVDHGPILAQRKVKVDDTDTTDTLHVKLFALGTEMIRDLLPKYIDNKITLNEQNHSSATFTKHLSKSDGQIDLNQLQDKDELDRMIRAYFPWPNVWMRIDINGKEKIIKLMPSKKIQVEGGKPMSYKDFFNGYPDMRNILEGLIDAN